MRRRVRRWRGGILLETLVSLALFAGAASFALASMRSVIQANDLAERRAQAVDLARTKMAQLETGMISLLDLRNENAAEAGSDSRSFSDESMSDGPRWIVEIDTEPSEYTGLTLVILTVKENGEHPAYVGSDRAAAYSLRQLVALRGAAEVRP